MVNVEDSSMYKVSVAWSTAPSLDSLTRTSMRAEVAFTPLSLASAALLVILKVVSI